MTDILIREGELVEKNQLLVRLDATRFSSTLYENRVQYLGLQAKAARLIAISEGKPFTPDKELAEAIPEVLAQEFRLYESSIKEYEAEQAIAKERLIQREEELGEATAFRDQSKRSYSLAGRELTLTKPLVSSGAVSEVEMLRLEREVSSLRGDLAQAESQINGANAAIKEARRNVEEVGLQFKNNIVDGQLIGEMGGHITNNIYTSLAWNQKAKYGWLLGEGEMLIEDRALLFSDYVNGDYSPVAGSIAINSGAIVNVKYDADYDGNDIVSPFIGISGNEKLMQISPVEEKGLVVKFIIGPK